MKDENIESGESTVAVASEKPDTWQSRLCETARRPFWLLSPTWGLANVLKPRTDRKRRATIIRRLNLIYFLVSLAVFWGATLISRNDLAAFRPQAYVWWAAVFQYILLSRFFEVSCAFLRDAFEKLEKLDSSSDLRWGARVVLAMRSYVELIFNFALIYALVPESAWLQTETPKPPHALTDLAWYSGNVVTTSDRRRIPTRRHSAEGAKPVRGVWRRHPSCS